MDETTRILELHLASLEQDARQPRLAMEADGPADTKTRERTESAATAVQAMHGDSCSANRVDPDPMCSTSFGDDCTGPPTLPCSREDGLVDNGAAAPKSCLSLLEMRSPTAAGGLLPTGETSTATRTTFDYSTLWFCQTEAAHSRRTSILSAWYDSSFRRNKLLAPPSCRRVIETKSGQKRMFDPGGYQGRLRACPFLGTWRALLCGDLMRVGAAGDDLQRFWRIGDSGFKNLQEWYGQNMYAVRIAVNRWFFITRLALNMPCQDKGIPSRAARGYRSSRDERRPCHRWRLEAIGCQG